eukprot:GHVO01014266.1.p1 GENE.GHVO01014266.1~~GHVO01014266.1.p1  ORF type:complete len:309 (-),score=41.22 GHVO01014266.1:40-966(-)
MHIHTGSYIHHMILPHICTRTPPLKSMRLLPPPSLIDTRRISRSDSSSHIKRCGDTARSISPIFWVILLTFFTTLALAHFTTNGVNYLVLIFSVWILSLVFHEWAHAYTAYLHGDTSVKEAGYLTLDIMKYVSVTTSIIIPCILLLLGGLPLPGGMVMTNDPSSSRARTLIALAGPSMNIVFGTFLVGVYHTLSIFRQAKAVVLPGLALSIEFQIIAVALNLLPLPPLDGWNAIEPYIPNDFFIKRALGNEWHARSIQIIIIIVLIAIMRFTPLFSWISIGAFKVFFIDPRMAAKGQRLLFSVFKIRV